MQTKKNIKITLIIILMLVEVFTIHLMYKSSELKNSELPKVKIKNENNISKKQFAIMLETSAGSKEYENKDADYPDALPTEGYVFNEEKSGCIDINGKEVTNVLNYDYSNYAITLNTNSEVYCYLYYDVETGMTGLQLAQQAIANKAPLKGLNNAVEGGMYRYQGSCSSGDSCAGIVDNYICFGTTSKEECLANTDQYMYRIIGIDSASNELKLIKKEAINQKIPWYYQYYSKTYTEVPEIYWPKSDLAQRLNGYTKSYNNARDLTAEYVDSGTSYPYMNKTGYGGINWYNLISAHRWYYGDTDTISYTASEIYKVEIGQSNATWYASGGTQTSGKWTQMSESEALQYKIGLMQLHDYYYSQTSGGNNCSSSGDYTTCKTSWIFLGNNDARGKDGITTGPSYDSEWTMSRRGRLKTSIYNFNSWSISYRGSVSSYLFQESTSVCVARPVFYLTSNVKIEGDGTFANPYRITNVT